MRTSIRMCCVIDIRDFTSLTLLKMPRPAALRSHDTARSHDMVEHLREEAADCRACPLWAHATQTVFGEGSAHGRVMFVGEQPGDEEDKAGRPFVGPAGRVLDQAMA